MGRALRAAVARGALSAPRRTIRFLWLPEIAGAQAWLVRNPERAKGLVAGIHMDMVGGLLATTHGTFHLSRSAESLPHVINVVAGAWFDDVVAASSRHAESGGDPRTGLVWAPGSREAFLGDVRALEMGSDHEVFQEASFGVPMVYFHDWPDVTIHTNKDLPENLDATKLGRVAYLGAGVAWTIAALPDAEAVRLLAMARGEAERRMADARQRAFLAGDPADGPVIVREAAVDGGGPAALAWPRSGRTAPPPCDGRKRRSRRPSPASPLRTSADSSVPIRNPAVRGPVSVYYYDHLAATLGDTPGTALASRRNGELLAYECLNFVDGRRSVAEIRDLLTGRYEPLPVAEVAEYLGVLARAGVVSWR